jgi:hypothetical protein
MSTRSSIAIKHGTVIKAVYCHFDGYLDYVGRVLHNHYQASPKVNNLIALGDLSVLGTELGEQHEFDNRGSCNEHGFQNQCTFYTRDRGENTPFSTYGSEQEWIRDLNGAGVEYYYLYDSGVWYVDKGGYNDFVPLNKKIERLDLKEKHNRTDLVT